MFWVLLIITKLAFSYYIEVMISFHSWFVDNSNLSILFLTPLICRNECMMLTFLVLIFNMSWFLYFWRPTFVKLTVF